MHLESHSIVLKLTRRAFIFGCVTSCVLFLSIDTAYAQTPAPRSYFFVEVRDTEGQVITDATVTVSADGKLITSKTTDENGRAQPEFPPRPDHHYDVKISKDGYVPSERVYFRSRYGTTLLEGIPNYFKNPESPVVVLRKTPVTPADRHAAEVEEQKYQLLLAAKRGDAATLRKLLQAGVKADTEDANVVLAITWAAFAGDPETIKLLLAAGADVGNKSAQGHQALLIYLDEGIPRQNRIRKPGMDSNAGSEKLWRERCDEAVLKLIAAGAGVNIHNSYGAKVLNRALVQVPDSLSSKTIRALIAAGANANDQDDYEGWTPLMFAAQTGSVETIKLLLKAGASINAKSNRLQTALLIAQFASMSGRHYNPEVVKALIAAKANVNAPDNDGRTPLMTAAQGDLLKSVNILLEAGATINAKDREGQSALMYAFMGRLDSTSKSIKYPSSAVVHVLISAGAKVNDANIRGETPLILAARTNSLETVKILLEAGASVTAKDKKGQTVLIYDELYYHFPHLEIIKALIAASADIHAVDEYGRTPLMMASQSSRIEIVQELLEAGARVNAKDYSGKTSLIYACFGSDNADPAARGLVVTALIAAGANVNEVDRDGQTPLMAAVLFGYYDSRLAIVKTLFAAGANANLKDRYGQTALDLAKRSRLEALVKLLEEVTKP